MTTPLGDIEICIDGKTIKYTAQTEFHRPVGKWNLKFHFRNMSRFFICICIFIKIMIE